MPPERRPQPIDPSIERTPGYLDCSSVDGCENGSVIRQLASDVRKLVLHLEGDGTDDRPGIKIEMDRLKRDVATMRVLVFGAVGLILVAVVTALIGLVVMGRGAARSSQSDRTTTSALTHLERQP